jgi:hypothetical protein
MTETILSESRKKNFLKRNGKYILFIILIAVAASAYISYKGKVTQQGGNGTAKSENSQLTSAPDDDADVYGMITSVKGNQITVMKFDPSTMPGAKQSNPAEQDQALTSENAISLGTSSSGMPGGGMPRVSGMPSGPPGEIGGFGGSGSSNTREKKLEELKATSIGTETITVPVGIPIIVQSSTATGASQAAAGTLKDLTSDTVIVLWKKSSAGTVASAGEGESETANASYINVTGKVDMSK